MIPRNELIPLLNTRLEKLLSNQEIEELANQILSIEDEWEEMDVPHQDMGYIRSDLCSCICWLAEQREQGAVIKFQRKKKA